MIGTTGVFVKEQDGERQAAIVTAVADGFATVTVFNSNGGVFLEMCDIGPSANFPQFIPLFEIDQSDDFVDGEHEENEEEGDDDDENAVEF